MAKFWSRHLGRQVQLKLAFNRTTHGGRDQCNLKTFGKLLVFDLAPHLTESLFRVFSEDSDYLTVDGFVDAVNKYSSLSSEESVEFLFKLYDRNNAGVLSEKEIEQILETSCDVHSMEYDKKKLRKWVKLITAGKTALSLEELKQLVASDHNFELKISVFDWFVKPERVQENCRANRLLQANYYKHNFRTVSLVTIFFAITIGLGIERYFSESEKHTPDGESRIQNIGVCQVVNNLSGLHSMWELWARIFGKLLNFFSMMVLVLVLRNLITLMRRLGFNRFLPLDHHIYFHKMIGYLITLYSIAHTLCHAVNVLNLAAKWDDVWCILFTTNFEGSGLVKGSPILSGWVLLVVLAIMVAFSLPAIRRSGHFQLFFNTHRLYFVYFLFLIIHAPKFWQWLLIPGLLYLGEVTVTLTGLLRKFGRTHVTQAELFKGNTVALTIAKPAGFSFRGGDYLYLNVPKISKYEWHAFTISSAPELDHLTLHIRVVGEWTRYLQEMINSAYKEKVTKTEKLKPPTPAPKPRTPITRRHTMSFLISGIWRTRTPEQKCQSPSKQTM